MIAPVVAITPGDGRDLGPWLESLGGAGLQSVVLREPALTADAYAALVEDALRSVPQVIVHAKNPAAEGIAKARGLPIHFPAGGSGRHTPFGVSCHDQAELDAAFEAGAAWTFLGPVWPTGKSGVPLGAARFLELAADRPVWALGGVTAERWAALRAAGARGVAGIGFAFDGTPALAAERIRALLRA